MKTLKHLCILAVLVAPFAGATVHAQDENRPAYVALTTDHFNLAYSNDEAAQKEWMSLEKEYLDKVTKKNDFVMSSGMLVHYYTPDKSEVVYFSTYKSWEDIDKAGEKFSELEEAAWPDKAARTAFLHKLGKYYQNHHSDEIYSTLPGAKMGSASDTASVVYLQKVERAYPDDGTNEEFEKLRMEYNQKVIQKNPYIVEYYPMRHAWGANSRDFVNVFVVNSFCDIDAMNKAIDGLISAGWPDAAKRKAFFDRYHQYFTGEHGDYIYDLVHELGK